MVKYDDNPSSILSYMIWNPQMTLLKDTVPIIEGVIDHKTDPAMQFLTVTNTLSHAVVDVN